MGQGKCKEGPIAALDGPCMGIQCAVSAWQHAGKHLLKGYVIANSLIYIGNMPKGVCQG